MFRIGVICAGLTDTEGAAAIPEILWEFHNRPRHLNPQCVWRSPVLALVVESPFDSTGVEVLEDFKEAVYARVQYSSGMLRFLVESVAEFIP